MARPIVLPAHIEAAVRERAKEEGSMSSRFPRFPLGVAMLCKRAD
jgi:hypothetical protein